MTAAPYWELLDRVLVAALPLVGAIISGYVILLLHKLAQRLNLKVTEANELRIRTIVQNALFAVEELARARYKRNNQITDSETKRVDAVNLVLEKLNGKNVQEVSALVMEELPKVRAQLAPTAIVPVVMPVPES